MTTFGIPATAALYAEYSSVRELEKLSRMPEFTENTVFHIGGGSNLLFKGRFDGLVVHSAIKGITFYHKNDDTVYVIAGAGERWDDLVDATLAEGYGGLENLAGIPGEVGASAVQNVGAYGVEAGDRIFAVECFDNETRKIVRFTTEECRFGYRDSMFKQEGKGRYFILRVSFKLRASNKATDLSYGPLAELSGKLGREPEIAEVAAEVRRIRDSKLPDPKIEGSAGSFFKNPVVPESFVEHIVMERSGILDIPYHKTGDGLVKLSAAWLIDKCGLKGHRIGGAEVYPGQPLVIVNKGDATSEDVITLSRYVEECVDRKFGVWLSPEVNLVDSDIHVTVLGSGTSKGVPEPACSCDVCHSEDPHDKRQRASVMVRTQGVTLLIDASPDLRAQALHTDLRQIDALLVTHSHYDHVGGIDDLRPFCREESFPIYLKHDVAEDLRRRLDYCFREHLYPGVPRLDLHEIGDTPFIVKGIKVIPIHVMHGKLPILGYRIGDFAYITDAKTIDPSEEEKLYGLKVLIVNALRRREHFAHFDLDEALALIDRVKPGKAYLTHLNHEMGFHKEVEKILPPNVHIAYDFLSLTVK